MSPSTAAFAKFAPQPFTSAEEANRVIAHLIANMNSLLEIVEKETELVRAGRLSEASRLETAKADLARQYMADVMRVKASHDYLATSAPDTLAALRKRHDTFHALLQINLTVLATAHAVSEGILRGVSDALARQAAPQTYGAGGRPNKPGPGAAQPLTLSRIL